MVTEPTAIHSTVVPEVEQLVETVSQEHPSVVAVMQVVTVALKALAVLKANGLALAAMPLMAASVKAATVTPAPAAAVSAAVAAVVAATMAAVAVASGPAAAVPATPVQEPQTCHTPKASRMAMAASNSPGNPTI